MKDKRVANELSIDDCINSRGRVDNKQLRYAKKTRLEAELMVFNVEKFVEEKIGKIIQSIQVLLSSQEVCKISLEERLQVVEAQENIFIEKVFQHSKISYFRSKSLYDIKDVFDFCLFTLRVPETNKLFIDVLDKDKDKLKLYNWTRDKMICKHFQSPHQIMILSSRQENPGIMSQGKRKAKPEKGLKPDKNVYPALFTWIMRALLEDSRQNVKQQNEEFIEKEVIRLMVNRDKISEEISSDFAEAEHQLTSLKPEDLKNLVQSWNISHSVLSGLKEKLSQVGIDEEMMIKYYKDYQLPNPSFNKIYKLQDSKQIYFWITLMAMLLKELPLEANQLKKSSLMYWDFAKS